MNLQLQFLFILGGWVSIRNLLFLSELARLRNKCVLCFVRNRQQGHSASGVRALSLICGCSFPEHIHWSWNNPDKRLVTFCAWARGGSCVLSGAPAAASCYSRQREADRVRSPCDTGAVAPVLGRLSLWTAEPNQGCAPSTQPQQM